MDVVTLVARARAGDVEAFTELVRQHQRLALGSAMALLRDPEGARDVTQDAFVAAWRGLAALAEPRAFPAWLHGIVRRCAFHALRARHLEPLAAAEHLPGDAPGADEQVDLERRRGLALAALAGLPEGLREPAVLRYVHDCSQAQIGAFLGLPVTTVNNRLHAARVRLKRRMLAMMKDAFSDPALPEDFPARIGRILRAEGPVVEARFEPAGPPELFSTLLAADEAGRAVTIEVVQHLPGGRVRAVARDPAAALAPGMQVVERGGFVDQPLAGPSLRSAIDRLVPPAPAGLPVLLETGVKVIDVLVPFARGRSVAILGGHRIGTTVLMEELVRRLATTALSVFTFFPVFPGEDVREVREKEGYTFGMGGVETVFFMADGQASRDAFDAVVVLSAAVAAMKIWPAIDPLASTSRWLSPEVAGDEHVVVAGRIRRCLEEADALQGHETLDDAARLTVARARKLRRFFAQPFFIAEPYTKRPGAFVPRADALAACAAIVDGVHDDVPEEAFSFVGGIDAVLARAGRRR
jgi:RNA polymerase sigma factor (sigma-70 family)